MSKTVYYLTGMNGRLATGLDEAYGYNGANDDASRVAFLFMRFEELTSLLPTTVVKKKRVKKSDIDLLI